MVADPVLLEATSHSDLRVDDRAGSTTLHNRNTAVIVDELQRLSAYYPTFFVKNPETGRFALVAIFGFSESENLFVESDMWRSNCYVPLNIRRAPFMLGNHSGDEGDESVVLIDLGDKKVQKDTGEALFNERGFPTPYLENKISVLKTLKDGMDKTQSFIEVLVDNDLLTPVSFKIEFENGSSQQIEGLYTIHEAGLQSLDDDKALEFYKNHYFEYAYMMISSIGQVQRLIDDKNKLLQAE